MTTSNSGGAPIEGLQADAYRIPTDFPEADGTYSWDATTLVVVQAKADGTAGLGYTYAGASIVPLLRGPLRKATEGRDSFDIPGTWMAVQRSVRNLGRN